MFTLAKTDNYTYPVKIETIGNGGAVRKEQFTVVFKRLSTSEVADWATRFTEANRTVEGSIELARELAHKVVEDWKEVLDANGTNIEFSQENLTAALDVHPVPTSIAQAWLESVNGGAKRKN